jgi:adhesin transport system membrane fusion protein
MSSTSPARRALLSEAAYRERLFPALRLTSSSRRAQQFAKFLLVLLALAFLGMFWVPWQQTAVGRGTVVAYDPTQRHQEVDAPISGRIVNWSANVFEGAQVSKGEILFEIEVVDPDLKVRMSEQLSATERKLDLDRTIVTLYSEQVKAFTEVKQQVVVAGEEWIKVGEQKIRAEEQELEFAQAEFNQSQSDHLRRQRLLEQGVVSQFEADVAERKAKESAAKLEKAKAYLQLAQNELKAKQAEIVHKTQEAQAKIDSAQAIFQKAQGDVESTQKEIAEIKGKQSLQTQPVRAPLDGFIFKMKVAQGGQVVSQGAPMLELVPTTADRAVAIKVTGNDVPLVASNAADGQPRKVRLQFEGWPAVQFSGWPSTAIGTFGGIVAVVDQTDDGEGKFRVLVVPDPDDPHPWPPQEILRQGTRVDGWVLLNMVPLGKELWRQMNGFPPNVKLGDTKKDDNKLLRSKK